MEKTRSEWTEENLQQLQQERLKREGVRERKFKQAQAAQEKARIEEAKRQKAINSYDNLIDLLEIEFPKKSIQKKTGLKPVLEGLPA